MTRSTRQGGVESPWTFNLVIQAMLARKKAALAECGILLPILGSVVVAGWADNVLFLSRTLESTQRALGIFTQGLQEMGWRWKALSMQYMCVGLRDGPEPGSKRKARER